MRGCALPSLRVREQAQFCGHGDRSVNGCRRLSRRLNPANVLSAPLTSVFNDYVRSELKYETDLPYYTSAGQLSSSPDFRFWKKWDWGSAIEGFPDTASALRVAMTRNPYLKVLVMEGYYDLATPFSAAEYTMNHLDLSPQYRKNISVANYDSGHMVYLRADALAKFRDDVDGFIDRTTSRE